MRVGIFGREFRGRSPRVVRRRLAPEILERRRLLTTFQVTSTADDGSVGTLRWAIIQVNQDQTPDTIDFQCDERGIAKIELVSPLPSIANSVLIDGTSQQGYSGIPRVELVGSQILGPANGLTLSSGGSTISGLAINGFSGAGILLENGDGNVVTGNYLGTDSTGTIPQSNGVGILIEGSSNNTIGGVGTEQRNLISGNYTNGVQVSSPETSSANVIQGNIIGLDSSGTRPLPNGLNGILLDHSALNTIGGTLAGAGNVISGNLGSGIVIETDQGDSSSNLIQGNVIGLTSDGTTSASNSEDGIALFGAVGTTIGGLTAQTANVISCNLGSGLNLSDGTSSSLIQGNYLGTDSSGTQTLGNDKDGIFLSDSPSNSIGGTLLGSMNVISANLGNGIDAQGVSDHLVIQGNAIGTDPAGQLNLGNQSNGLYLLSSHDMVGGMETGAGNIIDFNGTGSVGTGIQLGNSAQQDSILSNSIFGNHRLGINLGNGPTPNHDQGSGIGANSLQNYPVLNLGQNDQLTTHVEGTLKSTPNSSFVIQFFSSPTVDVTGFGPGKTLLGSITVTTDQNGNATFSPTDLGSSNGRYLTATATDSAGDTSEFSQAIGLQSVADLGLSLSASSNVVHVGDDLTYLLTVTNQSAAPATGVQVSDTISASVSLRSISTSQGETSSVIGPFISVDIGMLEGGASASLSITVQTQSDTPDSILDTGTVTSQSLDPNPSNNSGSITTTVRPAADLGVSVVADAKSVQIEGASSFTITVTNQGPSIAQNVLLDVPPNSSGSFVSSTFSSQPSVAPDGTLSFSLGDLDSGASVSFSVVFQAASTSGLSVSADVSSDLDDLNLSNNSETTIVPVTAATQLSVSISANQSEAYRGLSLSYSVVVENSGPCDASGSLLALTLPTALSFISAQTSDGISTSFSDGILSAPIGLLKAGDSTTLTVVVQPTMSSPDMLLASASVSSAIPELDPSKNSASFQTKVANASDLSIRTTSWPSMAQVGQPLTYILEINNLGPSDDPDVEFQEALPAGLSFISATSSLSAQSQPIYLGGILSAQLGDLAAGATATITVQAVPTSGTKDGVLLSSSAAGLNFDTNPSNNTTTSILNVAPVDLNARLVPSQSVIKTGDLFTLTAYVQNVGPTTATNVQVSLPVSPLTQIVNVASNFGGASTLSNNSSTSLGELASGMTGTVTFELRAIASGQMLNTVSVTSDEFNSDPDQGMSEVTCSIEESAGIITFGSPNTQVLQTAGTAFLSVLRNWGSAGTITVNYQTVPGTALAGVDYVPISGALTFLPGQTSQVLQIPVLDTPHSQSAYTLSVVLSSGTPGAIPGGQSIANVTIQDPSPDTTPPRISNLSLLGSGKQITGIALSFSESIVLGTAQDPLSYQLIDLGADGKIGSSDDQSVAISELSYNPQSDVTTLIPAAPLQANHYYAIEVIGSGSDAIRDLAGNQLDGSGLGLPGTNYSALFARGSNLKYKDSSGNTVNLRLLGPGYLDQIRNADGDGEALTLKNVVPGKSTLTGSVERGRFGSGTTQLGALNGLGSFGQIRVKLSSPAFALREYPFQQPSLSQPLVISAAKPRIRHAHPRLSVREVMSRVHHG